MVELCALASGSNGNCYYIGNEREAILIDVGISCKLLLKRFEESGLDVSKVKAIFITHEHADHNRGTRVFSNRYHIPVYFTPGTYYGSSHSSRPSMYRFLQIGQSFQLGDFTIHTFSKKHDSADPCSFRIEIGGTSVGVMTDIGAPCPNVIDHLKSSNILFLESNYDEKMLWDGNYSWPLKKRIASDHGHLSNIQAFNLIYEHAEDNLKTIILSHLSGENNTPDLAYEVFMPLKDKYSILRTSRHQASEVLRIDE